MGVAEPPLAVGVRADLDAVGALRLGLDRSIDEPDDQRRAGGALDHALGDPALESSDDDRMGVDLGGEIGDLLLGLAGAHVEPRVPVGPAVAKDVEAFERELDELFLRALDGVFVVIFDDRSSLGLVRLRVKKASAELEKTFEVLLRKSEAERGNLASRFDSPFAEITDEDIDSLFSE